MPAAGYAYGRGIRAGGRRQEGIFLVENKAARSSPNWVQAPTVGAAALKGLCLLPPVDPIFYNS